MLAVNEKEPAVGEKKETAEANKAYHTVVAALTPTPPPCVCRWVKNDMIEISPSCKIYYQPCEIVHPTPSTGEMP